MIHSNGTWNRAVGEIGCLSYHLTRAPFCLHHTEAASVDGVSCMSRDYLRFGLIGCVESNHDRNLLAMIGQMLRHH